MDRRRRRTALKLPPEICAKICEDLGTNDCVVLCRTSRAFGDQAQRLLYHSVALSTARALRSWSLAVTRHSHLAERVYALSLGLPSDLVSSSDFGKIARALSRCLHLKELHIHHERSGPFDIRFEWLDRCTEGWLLPKCPFRLTKFSNSFYKISFLAQLWTPQSEIRVLSMPACTEKFPCHDDQLPNLIALEVGDVPGLPTDRGLERIQLWWRRLSEGYSLDQLSYLGRYSATLTTLNLIQPVVTRRIATVQIFHRVAHALPGLLHFGINEANVHIKVVDRFSEPSPLAALAKFTKLETFVIYCQTITSFEDFSLEQVYEFGDDLSGALKFGQAIMEACPTLRRTDVGARKFRGPILEDWLELRARKDHEYSYTLTRGSKDGDIMVEYSPTFDFHAVAMFWTP
ncbi:hypothetical protein C8R47DRAFT_1150588 [Mycena vitilis]|nr:hypothetical protein C8R47DRAFT_1150588 [Mycena vitilis]